MSVAWIAVGVSAVGGLYSANKASDASDDALAALYGEFGAYGVVSLNKPVSPRVPYTSSVEIW